MTITDQHISLSDINSLVKEAIQEQFPALYWVRAEISEMKVNASGHCYLELVEKDIHSGRLIAKAQGRIWANIFRLLCPYFEKETGHAFTSGLKVLVLVAIDFHEVYGYGLTISDIDPAFTVGDMQQHRTAVLKQLEKDGILTLNKELPLNKIPKRIAVISSETASGYEDFENHIQLHGNKFGFLVTLFSAIMQGEQTEKSIISALDRIYEQYTLYDVVVIIRGGGATSDLSCFDSYSLAANCAQFPLPVITGIGHEKDCSVLDLVAHTHVKTPTAVADFLVSAMNATENDLLSIENSIIQQVTQHLLSEKNRLISLSSAFSVQINQVRTMHLSNLMKKEQNIHSAIKHFFSQQKYKLELSEKTIKLAAPESILKKGYTLTLKNGKIIKNVSLLEKGEKITTRFFNGNIDSIVQ